jgi:hypothetical protein
MLDRKNKKYLPGTNPGFQVRGRGCTKKKLRQKIVFFPILGGGAPGAPGMDPPLLTYTLKVLLTTFPLCTHAGVVFISVSL